MRENHIACPQELAVQLEFRPGLEEARVDSARRGKLRLSKNIRNSLEAGRQGFEILSGPHLLNGLQARFHIDEIVRAGGKYGVHLVVLESADLAEIVLHAIDHELT